MIQESSLAVIAVRDERGAASEHATCGPPSTNKAACQRWQAVFVTHGEWRGSGRGARPRHYQVL